MKLKLLLESISTLDICGSYDPDILGIAYDSRMVQPGWLFVAVSGHQADGASFITEALSKGAVAVVSENDLKLGSGMVHVQVANARRALAELSCAYFGDLSRQMTVVGVTGTNGKTTTSYMIREIFKKAGMHPGLLGTVAYEIGERAIPASRTTPEATDIHAMFKQMKDVGCDSAVLEVSSHAIALDRVYGIDFNVSIFTNLTQDHLDYHKDMDSYFDVKAQMFKGLEEGQNRSAVINVDDPWGRRLVDECQDGADVLTYGFGEKSMICASDATLSASGTKFNVVTPWGNRRISLQLLGRFNIHNALAAIASGGLCGVDLKVMAKALEGMKSVPGRLELVANRKGKKVFVDYAHTDDALKNVLTTLREICKGKLVVVFGCGGDRDHGKRPKMGKVAAELADMSIITSDNSRSEDPQSIAEDIMKGYVDLSTCEVILDRFQAIEKGLQLITRKDVLLVAGKGHETYQEFQGTIVPFDDRETVREILG